MFYDPLTRLTAADYSTGNYYHYPYDAVGNRKRQDSMIGGTLSTDLYNYDDANRLNTLTGSVTASYSYNGLSDPGE